MYRDLCIDLSRLLTAHSQRGQTQLKIRPLNSLSVVKSSKPATPNGKSNTAPGIRETGPGDFRTWFVAFSARSWSLFSSFLTFSLFLSASFGDASTNLIQTLANDWKNPTSEPTSKPFLTPNENPSLRSRSEATRLP